MIRVSLALIIVGGVIIFFGYQEHKVSEGTSTEPLEITLGDLEKDTSITNTHLKIGPHWRLYPACVYEYETSSYSDKVSESSSVNYAYYPIISENNPFYTQVDKLVKKYGTIEKIPERAWPEITNVAVLVKTDKFNTIGDIPDDWQPSQEIKGLIINKIESLDSEEKDLMRQCLPKVDLDKILLLEEGRTPSSATASIGIMAGGGLIIVVGIGIMILMSKKDKARKLRQPDAA